MLFDIVDKSILEYAGGIGGIGAILAIIIVLMYRSLVIQMRSDRVYMEDRLNSIIESYNQNCIENTKAIVELTTWLKTKNGD